ncbi:MAG: Uma2 family endonuclease [Gemmataceae bacterium]
MSILTKLPKREDIDYPDSDGQPMSDNTLQFEWIVTIEGGLEALFRNDPNVFVAGDLLWYPAKGDNTVRTAPDAMVVFGRPKGYRGSYKQWEEENIGPQVVFEVLSPGNRLADMVRKFQFYNRFGVEEYYVYNPDKIDLEGWLRKDGELQEITDPLPWISPRLQVRFELAEEALRIYGPDGKPFSTYVELVDQREKERLRAERLAAQLRALGLEPEG